MSATTAPSLSLFESTHLRQGSSLAASLVPRSSLHEHSGHTCLKLRGCLMSLRLNPDNSVCGMFLSEWTIVTSTMTLMEIWIIKNRLWWFCSWRQMTEHLIISLEQSIDECD